MIGAINIPAAQQGPVSGPTTATGPVATVSGIPIRNIWLLMLYASNLLRQIDKKDRCRVEENPDEIVDLVASILVQEVERRLRRSLCLHFQQRNDWLRRVRGRIDMLETGRHQLLSRGQVACRFDELSINTPRNRYVRAALNKVAGLVWKRNQDLGRRCRAGAAALEGLGVVGGKPGKADGPVDHFGRSDVGDRRMVAAAQLAFDLALPTEEAGDYAIAAPDRDERWMRTLFEAAVKGFYEFTLPKPQWNVNSPWLKWPIEGATGGIEAILPGMKTDIVIDDRLRARRIIIDTKFTSILKPGPWDRERLSSGYIYQIYAYLRSQDDAGDPLAKTATGILLHPSTGLSVHESVIIQGHRIVFATIDLAATSVEIRERLAAIVM